MKIRHLVALAAATLVAGAAQANTTVYTYVGTWTVNQGPGWTSQPLAYTGQEAAALLYGGSASDYVTSTVDANAADINFKAWYSIIGYGQDTFADDYSNKLANGKYYDGTPYTYTHDGVASAFVQDNSGGRNFAFRVSVVPEPANIALMLAGVGLIGAQLKRRSAKSQA